MTDDSARLQRQLARDPQRLREDVQALEDGTAPDRPSDADYSAFGRRVAALLGSSTTWDDPAGILEDIGTFARRELGVSIGDQSEDVLAYWRRAASELGMDCGA